MLQPNFQDLPGFDRLPQEEDAIEERYRLEPEPELVKLLQDFGLFDDLGVQEIRSRLPHFTSLAHLLAIIHWAPRDWVRNVGARTVARLGAATYRLSCLSQNDDLVSCIQDTKDHVGRWDYYLTDQDLAAFQQEVENTVPRGRWNRELRTAIKNEIRMQDSLSQSRRGDNESTTIPSMVAIPEENLSASETAPSENSEGWFVRLQKRTKPYLLALLLLNLLSIVLILRYGLEIIGRDDPGIKLSSAPHAPTYFPTQAPTDVPTLEPRWFQLGDDIRAEKNTTKFGWSVALASSQFIAIIGSPDEEDLSGRAYVFKFDGCANKWFLHGPVLQGQHSGDGFGNSTDISDNGEIVAVGATGANRTGQVLVFKYSEDERTWVQRGQTLNGDNPNDFFGSAVSLSGDGTRLAVGSPNYDPQGVGVDAGLVRVFEYYEDEKLWKQLGGDLIGKEQYEKHGFSVKIANNGEAVVVGAPFYNKITMPDFSEAWGGRVAVYAFDSDQRRWGQAGKDILYSSPTERFGWSVDISTRGFYISVGAPWNGENGEASGQMRLFELDPKSQQWKIRGGPLQGEDVGRWFGNTVCLSNNGNTAATSLWCDMPWREECGYGGVRMFEYLRGQKVWKQVGRDLHGRTRFDPSSVSIAMAKDDAIFITGIDSNSGESVVRAFKPGQYEGSWCI